MGYSVLEQRESKFPRLLPALCQTTPQSFYVSFTVGETKLLRSYITQPRTAACHWLYFHGSSVWLSVTSTPRQEGSWLNWTCVEFQTSCSQQQELPGFGETLLCCAWLCVRVGQRNEWLWPIHCHSDSANGPLSSQTSSRLVCTKPAPTQTDSLGILLK